MKKLIFLFAFCIVVTNVFAQTAPEQLKKEGNANISMTKQRNNCNG